MSWQIRHEGSPNITTGLTAQKVLEGLHEGVWDLTDEVRGPQDKNWIPLEAHPFFEEALTEYEEPHAHHIDVEEHLDMNPLIDVALVLLIFFILTTSYDAMKKVMELPKMTRTDNKPLKVKLPEDIKKEFVRADIEARDDGKVVYKIDGQEVPEDKLKTAIEVGVSEGRKKLIVAPQDGVPWGAVITVIEAGRLADEHIKVSIGVTPEGQSN
jgi:biopolymer transport protein ExbD